MSHEAAPNPAYQAPEINEQLHRSMAGVVLDMTQVSGKTPIAILIHVEWADGGVAAAHLPPGAPRESLIQIVKTLGVKVNYYIAKLREKINTTHGVSEQ